MPVGIDPYYPPPQPPAYNLGAQEVQRMRSSGSADTDSGGMDEAAGAGAAASRTRSADETGAATQVREQRRTTAPPEAIQDDGRGRYVDTYA